MKKLILLPLLFVLLAGYEQAGTYLTGFSGLAFAAQGQAPGVAPPPPPPADYIPYMDKAIPAQPVAFDHQVHIKNGLQCMACHDGITKQPEIGFPTVASCMVCHQVIAKDDPEVIKLADFAAKKQEIPWVLVFHPDQGAHVFPFNHPPHLDKKLVCDTCHGDMSKVTVTKRVPGAMMAPCETCHVKMGVGVGSDDDFGSCDLCHTQAM